jgi:hypothetical protein
VQQTLLIGMQRNYPRDVFPSLWAALEAAIDAGQVCICNAVLEELERGTDDLHKWAKDYQGLLCEITQADVDLAVTISNAYPDWVREERNAADPFVVAHAANESRTIVTDESPAAANVAPQNQKVPSVAAGYGVSAIKFFEFARAERWSF